MKSTRWLLMIALATGTAFTARSVEADECANVHASRDALRASFHGNMDLRSAERSPVLLVPGTALEPDVNFPWNYVPALDAMGFPVCAEAVMPGVDPSSLASHLAAFDLAVATALGNGTHLTEEPPLACYTRGNGPKQ